MTVRYTRRAQQDLERILDSIAKESPLGARNVMNALGRAIRTIDRFPHCGYRVGRTRISPVRWPSLSQT